MTDIEIKNILKKSEFVNLDGPITDTKKLAKDIQAFQGDRPEVLDEDVVRKAFAAQGLNIDDLIKKARNIGNLQAIRRTFTNEQGTVYQKTVYVKREEVEPQKATKFLAQVVAENDMVPGMRVKAKFKGWSTGASYTSDKLEFVSATDDKITLRFYEPFQTGNAGNYEYPTGYEVVIPRTTSKEWSKNQWMKKKVEQSEPAPEVAPPVAATGELVSSIDQISVGQEVMVQQRGSSNEDLKGTIKYIHPNGNFIDIKVGDKVQRRKLGKFSTIPVQSSGLSNDVIEESARNGVNIVIGTGGSHVATEDRTRTVGTRTETYYVRVDRFGNRNNRGRSRAARQREVTAYYQYTDAEMRERRGGRGEQAIENFNRKWEGFDIKTWGEKTKATLMSRFNVASDRVKIQVNIDSSGDMSLNAKIPGRMTMTRRFNSTNKRVYHSFFSINRAADKGNGAGKELFRHLYEQYRNTGMKSIGVTANIDVGGYAWARYGFTSSRRDAERYVNSYENNIGRTRRGYTVTREDAQMARDRFDRWDNNNRHDERFPMNLLATIGPENKAGKNILLGTSWLGKIDLTNNVNRAHFENYIGMAR